MERKRRADDGDRDFVMKPRFLRPEHLLALEERTSALNDISSVVYNNPYISLSIEQQRSRLPIFKNRLHILYLLENFRTLIIVGETGCGKSTQVPQYLMEAGWANDHRKIGVTQPRIIAVVTLANRVAEEKMCKLGEEVGYIIRFHDATSENTKIKVNILIFSHFFAFVIMIFLNILMVDDAHERSVNTDLLLGLLRKILSVRNDLRIIVSSATLDAILFRDFFELNTTNDAAKNTSTIISVEGHMHPITIYHVKNPVPDYVQKAIETVLSIHKNEQHGDILVFLTGQDEIEFACKKLIEEAKHLRSSDKLWILPIYGSLPPKEQVRIFESTPHGTRKAIIATNIAEASVTIPGIVYVIDCGFVKLRAINADNGLETLMTLPISQASAEQRAGRAGRIRPGKCYRLYTCADEYNKLLPSNIPEMQRVNLAPVVLQLKALGINNVLRFHYVSHPSSFCMVEGLQLLFSLGALSKDGLLTNPLGLQMAEFPLPPMHSKALLCSGEFGCSEEIAAIIAMLQIQEVFVMPLSGRHKAELTKRNFCVEEGDHLTALNVFLNFVENGKSKQWCVKNFLNYRGLCRAVNIRDQMIRLLKRYHVPIVSCKGQKDSVDAIRKCLVKGFFSQAAHYHYSGDYVTIKEEYHFKVYKGSAIMYRKEFPKWVIFTEVLQDSIRDITVVEPEWLYELAADYYEFGTRLEILPMATLLKEASRRLISSRSLCCLPRVNDGDKLRRFRSLLSVKFITHGCQMNVNDVEIVRSLMLSNHYIETSETEDADVIFIMTCSVRESAEIKVWDQLKKIHYNFGKHKVVAVLAEGKNISISQCIAATSPGIFLHPSSTFCDVVFVKECHDYKCHDYISWLCFYLMQFNVLCCMAERIRHELLQNYVIDIVAGPDSYRDLPRLLAVAFGGSRAINVQLSLEETYADIAPVRVDPLAKSAYVSIMRGCDNMCTYCIVPFTRGRERSRPMNSIISEIRRLSDEGVKEVVLLGQNVNSYNDCSEMNFPLSGQFVENSPGFKTVYKAKKSGLNFTTLLEKISTVNQEMRIRFISPHPKDFPLEVISLIKERPNICKQFRLPAQSGSNVVLQAMGRKYTKEAYLSLVERIKNAIPEVSLSSDFITGFCGETEKAHEETLDLIKRVQYSFCYVYPFSMRSKTKAKYHLVDDIPEDIKHRRHLELVSVFREQSLKFNENLIGSIQLVLIDSHSKRTRSGFVGKCDGGTKVVIEEIASKHLNDVGIGDYVAVKVFAANSQTLRGRIIGKTTLRNFENKRNEYCMKQNMSNSSTLFSCD
ncbi:unnamed protein product [Dracunculus medinensis]|uniref:CDK5RAP1-like protein n=1 Tax=Dracunculus medinensis TaxID=318479 RepID=A0A0N4UF27_DRAME|nr:unnamed protein product [Dracunculus medinensis]